MSTYLTVSSNDERIVELRALTHRLGIAHHELEQKLLPPPYEVGHSHVSTLMFETNHLAKLIAEMNVLLGKLAVDTYATGNDTINGRRSL